MTENYWVGNSVRTSGVDPTREQTTLVRAIWCQSLIYIYIYIYIFMCVTPCIDWFTKNRVRYGEGHSYEFWKLKIWGRIRSGLGKEATEWPDRLQGRSGARYFVMDNLMHYRGTNRFHCIPRCYNTHNEASLHLSRSLLRYWIGHDSEGIRNTSVVEPEASTRLIICPWKVGSESCSSYLQLTKPTVINSGTISSPVSLIVFSKLPLKEFPLKSPYISLPRGTVPAYRRLLTFIILLA
jgi:hypothetical protein